MNSDQRLSFDIRSYALYTNSTMAPVVKENKSNGLPPDDVDLDALVEGMNLFPLCNMTKPLLENSNDSLASSKASGIDNGQLESSSSSLDEPSSSSSVASSPPANSRTIPCIKPKLEMAYRSKSVNDEVRYRIMGNAYSSSAPERSKSVDAASDDDEVPDPFPDIGGSPKWKFGIGSAMEELFSKQRQKQRGSLETRINLECVTQVSLRIWSSDGSWQVLSVDSTHLVEDVLSDMISLNHSIEDRSWSLVEYLADLQLERTIEDHENVLMVCRKWHHHHNHNRLYFKKDFRKYEVFQNPEQFFPSHMVSSPVNSENCFEMPKRPRQPLGSITNPLDSLPEISSYLYTKEGHKKTWKKLFFVLRPSGLYYSSKASSKDPRHLHLYVQFKDTDIYYATNPRKKHHAPSEFAFCTKTTNNKFSMKDMKMFCADDERTRQCWIAALRMVLYGKQLLENYQRAIDRTLRSKEELKPDTHPTGKADQFEDRVAMDFSGDQGRVIENPSEAVAIAKLEEYNWRRRGCLVRSPEPHTRHSQCHTTRVTSSGPSPNVNNGFHQRGPSSPRHGSLHSPRCSPCNGHSPPCSRRGTMDLAGLHLMQPWFHSGLSREETHELFAQQGMVDGMYLIRESQRIAGAYVLSFSYNQKVRHYQIASLHESGHVLFSIDEGATRFTDLVQLVEFYQVNSGGLPTTLLHACTNL